MHRALSARASAAALLLALAACERSPVVGAKLSSSPSSAAPIAASLLGARVDAGGRVTVRYAVTRAGAALPAASVAALQPALTLAQVSTDPVSGSPAWRSLVLTGPDVNPSLPVAGPGTPPSGVLVDQRQPGFEPDDAPAAASDGTFSRVLAARVPAGATGTLRVGLFLRAAHAGPQSCATLDLAVDGSTPARAPELVLDARCSGCHGTLRAHDGTRHGVRLCVTCHTLENADRQTVDPAAMAGATAATNPNPLDLGRLVHRIHRGRNLPTLYRSLSQAPAPALAAGNTLPLPFFPPVATPPYQPRNAPEPGRRYSVVGELGREHVFGVVATRVDNGMPARTLAEGVAFPRDLRSCDACHAGAADAGRVHEEVHRRTCQGCHPEIWFGDGGTDAVHFAHAGGPQPDETRCASCHVRSAASPDPYAPIADIHVPPQSSPRTNAITARILEVRDLAPGKSPTIVFTFADEDGTVSPLNAPVPARNASSPQVRAVERVAFTISGPTREYRTNQLASELELPYTEAVPPADARWNTADGQGRFTYTFKARLPADATGTWAVGMEARRRAFVPHYDPATDRFRWPYTGELFTESPDNSVVYVDTAAGAFPGGNPVPRRKVVDVARCEACHLRVNLHGGLRHQVEYCIMCHAPDRTDWGRRPGVAAVGTAPPTGTVNLAGTWDGIEERSVDFTVMVHRIHTGEHEGSAELPKPYVVYANGNSFFFDDVRFPNDLARCGVCHVGGTHTLEAMPADAAPIVANETSTIRHAGEGRHLAGEPTILPHTAACISCHGSATTRRHTDQYTTAKGETCKTCHAAASLERSHAVAE